MDDQHTDEEQRRDRGELPVSGDADRVGEVTSIVELAAKVASNLESRFQAQEAAGALPAPDEASRREAEAEKRTAWMRLMSRRIPVRAARVISGGVPAGKDGAGGDDGDIPPLDERTPAMLIVRMFMSGAPGTLCISGGVGCGKTIAAAWAVAQRTTDRYFGDHPDGWNGTWPTDLHPRFVDAARMARLPRWSGKGEQAAALAQFETCSLLAIDDLGMENDKGFAGILDSLVVNRHDNRLRTIMTTNMTDKQVEQAYGLRVLDRLREGGFFALNAPTRRGVDPR